MPAEIMNMATEILLNLLLGVIALLGALGTFYVQKGIRKLQAETEKIQDDSARNFFDTALYRLNDVAVKAVNAIEQTTKKEILKAIEDGSATKDELKNLSYQAYKEIVNTLEPEYMELIQGSMADAQTYIMNLIEEKLEEVKARKISTILSSPIAVGFPPEATD